MTEIAYESIKAMNWSRLKLLERSPAHFKANVSEETPSLNKGVAVHCAILEPEKFLKSYAIFTGKVRRGKEWDAFEFEATANGRLILNEREYADVEAMKKSVRSNPLAMKYLTWGRAEVPATWKIKALDLDCKGRIDYVSPIGLIDLKTTQSAHPRDFWYSCVKYGYDGQLAWYHDGWMRKTGEDLPVKIIAVESSVPFNVTVFNVPEAILSQGRERYQTLLAQYDYCTKNNFWGGYSETEVNLSAPEVK